ncbi:MAG: hypothetical protein PVG66_14860 [Chromatiales bacterium]|jgi:hypothetical protein
MGKKKLLARLSGFLSGDSLEKKEHRKELKSVLKKLKAKEKELREICKTITDEQEREQMEKEIDILHAQRKKGIKLLKEEDS